MAHFDAGRLPHGVWLLHMGYEIAGGLGVKMARPDREVVVMVGDGSYLMLNNEIATSVMLDKKLIIVLLDNRGYGCINRLQQNCGSKPFNNMWEDCLQYGDGAPNIDFAANAASLGALSEKVANIPELEAALQRARAAKRTYLSVSTPMIRGRQRKVAGGGRSPSRRSLPVNPCGPPGPPTFAEKKIKNAKQEHEFGRQT